MMTASTSTIQYSRAGSGESLVLVHGIGHRRTAWGPTFDMLAEHFDVISVDLPGFGETDAPQAPHTYAAASYVEQLEAFCVELGLERPHVAGDSLGGFLALSMARRGSVRSVTAFSPGGFWGPRPRSLTLVRLILLKAMSYSPTPALRLTMSHPALRRVFLRDLYAHAERVPSAEAIDDALNLRTSPGFWPVARANRVMTLPEAVEGADDQVPVTVAWGDKDHILPVSQMDAARELLPRARFEVLPDCGHVPTYDDPALVT